MDASGWGENIQRQEPSAWRTARGSTGNGNTVPSPFIPEGRGVARVYQSGENTGMDRPYIPGVRVARQCDKTRFKRRIRQNEMVPFGPITI